MNRLLLALVSCLPLLTACGPLHIRDAANGRYVPMQGGTFQLLQDITIPAGRTRIYFQDGAVSTGVNEFRPHCQLEVSTLRESPQQILADSFTITGINTRTDQVVQARPLQLAAIGAFHLAHDDGGPSRQMQTFLFDLHSDKQPDVRRLVCGGAFDHPALADRPSLQEIAAALGENATLTLR